MRQVKGSMFIMFAKAINADKTGAYDQFLTAQDKKILSGEILNSAWYPHETYKNCFLALSTTLANNDPKTLTDWGRQYGQSTMETVYKLALKKDDPMEAVNTYKVVLKNQFNFGRMRSEQISDNTLHIHLEGFDPDFEPWYYVALGWLERFLQLCIKKPVSSKIVQKSWEGAPHTVFEMSW
ncbi:MAG: hypothetical protein ACLFPD_02950 [Desulfosudaceae bacterium]